MGKLVAIEGIDRTGKSTQLERIAVLARERGLSVAATAYPVRSGTATGPLIDRFLHGELPLVVDPALDPAGQAFAGQVLFSLNRREAADALRVLLATHDLVLTGRYALSARAYAIATGVPAGAIARLHRDLESDLPVPDATLILDADPVLLARRERPGQLDAFDADLELQERVRDAYAILAVAERNVTIVDAAGEPDEVTARLVSALEAAELLAR